MEETRNNCFGWKIYSTTLPQTKTGKHECRNITYVAVIFWHLCLSLFAWRRVVLHIFDPKQLLRVSYFLWCYYPKCYSIILENVSLWCFFNKIKEWLKDTYQSISYASEGLMEEIFPSTSLPQKREQKKYASKFSLHNVVLLFKALYDSTSPSYPHVHICWQLRN